MCDTVIHIEIAVLNGYDLTLQFNRTNYELTIHGSLGFKPILNGKTINKP